MSKKTLAVLLLILSVLAGCSTTRGPAPTLTPTGPVDTTSSNGIAAKFNATADESFKFPSDDVKARSMMKNGFALVRANCDVFFSSAGTTQKWVVVTRDVVGAVGTLATGIMALHESSANAVANVAFGTAAAFAGLDIYNKNFLFAAENVSAVRDLIVRALDTHRQAAETITPATYESATTYVLDNQAICSHAKITALAREAIARGSIVASIDPQSDLAAATQVQDQKVLQGLGQLLNPPGALTTDQAGALWWLLKEFSTDDEKANLIAPKLSSLPAASSPFDPAKAYKPTWTHVDAVSRLLDGFSNATKTGFRRTIQEARAARQVAAKSYGAVFVVPTFSSPLSDSGATSSPGISVGIR